MLPNPIRPGRTTTPPFIQPYLEALNRIQERRALRPDEVIERARKLLDTQFGTQPVPAEAAFAHGSAGLLSEHTHYFDGFAVVKCLPFGTGVAARIVTEGSSRVVFEGGSGPWHFDTTKPLRTRDAGREVPFWTRVAQEIVCRMTTDPIQVEIAVVSTVPSSCFEGYLAALGIAVGRCYQGLTSNAISTPALLRLITEAITASIKMPFSVAYPITADWSKPGHYLLIDTSNLEHLPLETPSNELTGWGMIDVVDQPSQAASFYNAQKAKADEAVDLLQTRNFPQLNSLRDLDHSELQRALNVLPRSYKPIIRYLVTENRRVNKLVFAARRNDWQMIGALLLMSHASRRSDFKVTSAKADFVVEQIEGMSLEGIYGGCMSGRGGCVLVTGLPFIVPSCLDTINRSFEERFGETVVTMLL